MKLIALLTILIVAPAMAQNEVQISKKWCEEQGGVAEFKFPDNTRADCITDRHAIEFDWGPKWAQAVGQSLKYASNSGRRAGIMIILKSEKDMRYLLRLELLVSHYGLPIDVWYMYRSDYYDN